MNTFIKRTMILALALALSVGAWAQGLTDTEDTVSLTHDATFSVWTLDAMPDTDAVLLFTPAVPHSVTFAAAESGFSIAGGAATVSLDGQAATLTDNALQAYPGQTVTLTATAGYKFRSATASETQAAPATLLTLTISGESEGTIYYLQGETWQEAIANHPTENDEWSINGGHVYHYDEILITGGNLTSPDAQIDANGEYQLFVAG